MLKIDPEFEGKIPPLTEEEFRQLEENILMEGKVIVPLVVWKDLIVDGHNRYRIILEHPEITYSVYEKDFPERYSAIAWICKNQLGRRNLTPQQKKYLIGQRYEAEKMAHGGDRKSAEAKSSGQNDHLNEGKKTREKIAEETHTNDSYVRRAGEYARGVDAAEEAVPGTKQKILTGEIKPTAAAVAAVAKAPPEERKEKVEQFEFERKKLLPDIGYPELAEVQEETDADEMETETAETSLEKARRIGESMAVSTGGITLEDVFLEMEDAAESMLDIWVLCRKSNPELFRTKECRTGVKKLVREVTTFLNNFEGGLKQ